MKTAILACSVAALSLAACADKSTDDVAPDTARTMQLPVSQNASTCPEIVPMTRGQQILHRMIGPGSLDSPRSAYPEDPQFLSDYYLGSLNQLIPSPVGMTADDASELLQCFYTDTSTVSSERIPSYADADEIRLFRTGGHTGAFASEEAILYIEDGVVTNTARATYCDGPEPGWMGYFEICPLSIGRSLAYQDYGDLPYRDPSQPSPDSHVFGLYSGMTKADALESLAAASAPEYEGAEGYQAPTISDTNVAVGTRVEWQQLGYLDDAVAGERLLLDFRTFTDRDGNTSEQLVSAGWQQKCSRPGNTYWSTEACP